MKNVVERNSILAELSRILARVFNTFTTDPVRFQINRRSKPPTAPSESTVELATKVLDATKPRSAFSDQKLRAAGETLLILVCFALYAGQITPDVNESHYLTKAKHFWNPAWCPQDIFLSSSFSHWLFYISTGWLTKFVSLGTYAWIGRLVTWALLAFAWQRLSYRLIPASGMAFVTAVFFLLLNDQFHMAGEWVVGGFEAKGIAYGFVLLALERIVSRRWSNAWVYLGIACAFHVLVGGWAMLAAIVSWIGCEIRATNFVAQLQTQSRWIALGFIIASVGAIPPLLADLSCDPTLKLEAHRIYVSSRISHHLRFGSFETLNIARFAMITLAWLFLSRSLSRWALAKPLQLFCFAALAISFGGLLLSGLEEQPGPAGDWSRSLLRFYWFRLSDFAIPVGLALSSGAIAIQWIQRSVGTSQRYLGLMFVVLIFAAAGILIFEKNVDSRAIADQRSLPSYDGDYRRTIETQLNWKRACDWIRQNTPAESQFITPVNQQTFKWYAHRSEVASWKDVPQDAEAMIEWKQRILDLYEPQKRYAAGLMAYSDTDLNRYAKEYGADYLVIPQRNLDLATQPTRLKQVYPQKKNTKSTYVIFVFSAQGSIDSGGG